MQKPYPTLVAVHLLNDFSGSPAVFAQSLQDLADDGYDIHLYTCHNPEGGFLDRVTGITRTHVSYTWSPNKAVTLVRFFAFQAKVLGHLIKRYRDKNVVLYINTVLPFAAGYFGAWYGKKTVYHLHEATLRPAILKPFFLGAVQASKATCLYVSEFVKNLGFASTEGAVVYNALCPAFWAEGHAHRAPSPEKEVILVGSLKTYKGVFQFLELARQLPHRAFRLVVNADEATVRAFFGNTELPKNLSISQGKPSVHPYYQKAAVVLNLSLPDGWVETFGLTALEGMAYGLPVIVPPVGGIAEITPHGQVGYQVDARDINALSDTLEALLSSPGEYARLSSNALEHAKSFSPESFRANILKAFEKVCNSDK